MFRDLFLLLLALAVIAGCDRRDPRGTRDIDTWRGPYPPADQPATAAKEEAADAKVRRLEGELRQAKLERDDARLAGARRLLAWATGILALLAIGGVVAAIFMRSKLLGIAAVACAGGAASCQVLNRALDHIELISWLTLAAAVVVGGVMIWRYHHD